MTTGVHAGLRAAAGVGAALWRLAACSFALRAVRAEAARAEMRSQGDYEWGCLQSPWRKLCA